jgi:penicillin-binding protein 1C
MEDQTFYSHHGFDPFGIFRAFTANVQGKPTQGGSTITQQLVKNTVLSNERTLRRKIRELFVAIAVDYEFSKEEILEMYFNQVSYGGTSYGAQEAAERYFGKSAAELDLAEASLLAGLPAAPTAYSPFGQDPELAKRRQAQVLQRMVEDGYITQQAADAALEQELAFRTDSIDIRAPHFVMYVRQLLAQEYGEEAVTRGGLEVRTTLDPDTQQLATQAVREEVERLERLRVSNGAALVTNPTTGEVLAMVGSVDYFDFDNDGQVNATLRERQPGSSIKPVTYAAAFSEGFSPASIVDDSPVVYTIPGSQPYRPRNYDGTFRGPVSLRSALANSYNIPAVKILDSIGVPRLIEQGQDMGITTWNEPDRYGLALTLGAAEVRMLDMMQVYGTFANQGYTLPVNPILEITDYTGSTIYENECALGNTNCPGEKTLDPRVAAQITSVLKDNRARTPAFGSRSVLYIPDQEVAVKTGTSNDIRDNWTFGYTSDRVVGTWVGNFDNEPMSAVASGITGASPVWNEIMRSQLSAEQPHRFEQPAGMVEVAVCAPTGTLACSGCPVVRTEIFRQGNEPMRACNPAWFEKSEEEKTTE